MLWACNMSVGKSSVMQRIFVPDLSRKLDLLLRYDHKLTTRTALAGALGIAPSQISKWQGGGSYDGSQGMVPGHHFSRLVGFFDIDADWLHQTRRISEKEQ